MWLFLNPVNSITPLVENAQLGIWQSSYWEGSDAQFYNYPEEQHPPLLCTCGSSSMICTPRLAVPGWLEPLPLALSSTWAVSIIPVKKEMFRWHSTAFLHKTEILIYSSYMHKVQQDWFSYLLCRSTRVSHGIAAKAHLNLLPNSPSIQQLLLLRCSVVSDFKS